MYSLWLNLKTSYCGVIIQSSFLLKTVKYIQENIAKQ